MTLRVRPIHLPAFFLAAIVLSVAGVPGQATARLAGDIGSGISADFDMRADRTRITRRVGNACMTIVLPRAWNVASQDAERTVLSAADGVELEVVLRPARAAKDLPQSDIASRDAALLQRDHEGLFGRPAQAATLVSLPAGAKRWTATWVDASLPSASREVTLDTLIVPFSDEWVIELSLAQAGAPADYERLMTDLLLSLRREPAEVCPARTP